MKKMIVKRYAALALAMLLLALAPAALAEEWEITTPTDLAPVTVEEPTEAESVSNVTEKPQGTVRIVLLNDGPLYYGDEVALKADVDNVEDEHTLTWQVKVDVDKWENVATGKVYRFTLTPENASLEYRVIVNVAE